MSRIYWDTMLFIYWLEGHPDYSERVGQIYDEMKRRGDTLCTSALTLGEVLVGPTKKGSTEMIRQIVEYFRSSDVEVLPLTTETAERYAQIRASNRISPSDAIHMATAAHKGVDLFLTNDHRLRGLVIPGIQFTAGMDVDLF